MSKSVVELVEIKKKQNASCTISTRIESATITSYWLTRGRRGPGKTRTCTLSTPSSTTAKSPTCAEGRCSSISSERTLTRPSAKACAITVASKWQLQRSTAPRKPLLLSNSSSCAWSLQPKLPLSKSLNSWEESSRRNLCMLAAVSNTRRSTKGS